MVDNRFKEIDVTFDFTSDTPNYWDSYWEGKEGVANGKVDPDTYSKTLQRYHQILWSRELPNGETMQLETGDSYNYLTWKDLRFGSDAIIIDFLNRLKYKYMIEQIAEKVGNFRAYHEDLCHRSYTVGGVVIFPKHVSSMNQNKGTNSLISDRWDLTLECIRRYYNGEQSPLYSTIERDRAFYDLFVDFKGYVDFFFMQDTVSEDYSKVNIWCGDDSFEENGYPKTLDEYFIFIDKEYEFLKKRNQRIKKFCNK